MQEALGCPHSTAADQIDVTHDEAAHDLVSCHLRGTTNGGDCLYAWHLCCHTNCHICATITSDNGCLS